MFRRSILKILGGSVVLPALFSTAVTAGDMPAPFDNPGDVKIALVRYLSCLLYTSPSPRDRTRSRMPSSA